jgi:hypothetical protein
MICFILPFEAILVGFDFGGKGKVLRLPKKWNFQQKEDFYWTSRSITIWL